MLTCGQVVWVPNGAVGEWREWQYSPAYSAYHFVGVVGDDRVAYALSRYAAGENPNS